MEAQTIMVSDSLSWNEPVQTNVSKDFAINSLSFNGAIYTKANSVLPFFTKKVSTNSSTDIDYFQISSVNTTALTTKELQIIENAGLIPFIDTLSMSANVFQERKKSFITLGFYPVIKNKSTQQIEKIKSFTLKIVLKNKAVPKTRVYAANSILATGSWRKISTSAEGVYIIRKQDIVNMGLSPNTTEPNLISIFGNGGYPLSENNSIVRNDDIQELAVSVVGGGDGSFDDNDYVLFYAKSPLGWQYNSSSREFVYEKNSYSDLAYYFVTFDVGIGQKKRIQISSAITDTVTKSISSYTRVFSYEKERVNLAKSGRDWLGETFDLTTSYSFPFRISNLDISKPLNVIVKTASSSSATASFFINIGGASQSMSLNGISQSQVRATEARQQFVFSPASSNFSVNISYLKPTSLAIGYLNYINIIAQCNLAQTESQLFLRNTDTLSNSSVLEYTVLNGSSSKVWNVSDLNNVKQIPTTTNGTSLVFIDRGDSAYQYCIFNQQSYFSPSYVGLVGNQNLHALSPSNMVIVSHPNYLNEANRLKQFHENERGLTVSIVTPEEINNEFASGSPDMVAIRDFAKMCYDKFGPNTFKYLLLFGDATYDYRNILGLGGNFVPTYETPISTDDYASFASDDFFALLDDSEGENCVGLLDIGVGRFIANSETEAKDMVDKTIRYCSQYELVKSDGNVVSNFGDWKNTITIIGDDQDGNVHLATAKKLSLIVEQNYPTFNIEKIFFDAYPQVSNSGGQRYPDVETAINQRMRKGSLLMNYVGHGGEVGWAHERVLRNSDILSWENKYNMPIMLTATCEFTRYDDPERISAGELVFMNSNGGAAAMLTTSRVAWSSTNEYLCINFYNNAFERLSDNSYYALGDLIRISKNLDPGGWANLRNFVLIGDPSIPFAFPKHKIKATSINNNPTKGSTSTIDDKKTFAKLTDVDVKTNPDTLKALSLSTIKGIVTDNQDQKLSLFNGEVSVTIYDKPSTIQTLGNDPDSPPTTFSYQKNIIFKGRAKVVNGDFELSFIVPKDINYNYGYGKMSLYAKCDTADASGYFSNFIVGGYSNNAIVDNDPPSIKMYLNDQSFANLSLTNENPILIAEVCDSSGINIMGSAIGHDAIITLDKESENAIVVNDFFEPQVNSYQKGVFKYPFNDLSEGKHTLTFKVWDILNNSSEKTIEFTVVKEKDLALAHVLNYPNPFSTHTSFYFEHNQIESAMDVKVQIFTVTGKIVKTIIQNTQFNGFISEAIEWDGTDDYGDKLAKGVYLYKISVRTSTGKYAEKIEKLVIL